MNIGAGGTSGDDPECEHGEDEAETVRTADSGDHLEDSWVVGSGARVHYGRTADLSLALTTDLREGDGSAAGHDSSALVRRCQSGDAAAFTVLYHRHCDAVRAVCRRRVRDRDVVEDLVQETFSRFWAALPTFHGDGEPVHWLRRTAKNLCIDHHRRRASSELPVPELPPASCSAEDVAVAAVTRHAVAEVLAKLRPVDAALLQEHHMADRPLREMAPKWGSTEKALSVRLTRARRTFAAFGADLRGLLPLPLWFRLRWAARAQQPGAAGALAAMGAVQAVLAVLLVLPPAAAGGPAPAREPRPVLAAEQRPAAAAGDREAHAPRVVDDRGRSRAEGTRSKPGRQRGAAAEAPPVVAVPATSLRIDRQAPQRPDYRYDARVGHGEAGVGTWVSLDDLPRESDAVNGPACEAVASAPAAATCSRGGD